MGAGRGQRLGPRARRRGAKGSPPTLTAGTPPQQKCPRALQTRVHVANKDGRGKARSSAHKTVPKDSRIAGQSGGGERYKPHCTRPGKHRKAHKQSTQQTRRLEQVWPCPPQRGATRCHGYHPAMSTAPRHHRGKACATLHPVKRRLPNINEQRAQQTQCPRTTAHQPCKATSPSPYWTKHRQDPAVNTHQLLARPCAQNRHNTNTHKRRVEGKRAAR